MPIYEYVCQDCGERFELVRSMKDADAPIACKECASQHTTRQLSVFYANSGGRAIATSSAPGCASCSGGSCASCKH
jgi:putative FmdB family regulatory protein